jgi:ribosomal protein L12E/L44/L45/RPP1/RPP2
LEKDIQTSVQAVITALTLNGQELKLLDEQMATRLILKALAEDDVDEIMTQLFPDGETLPAGSGQIAPATASEARIKEAARKLASAILELKHEQ